MITIEDNFFYFYYWMDIFIFFFIPSNIAIIMIDGSTHAAACVCVCVFYDFCMYYYYYLFFEKVHTYRHKMKDQKPIEFYNHTKIDGKIFPCYTVFIVPIQTQDGDYCQVPAWIRNRTIRELGLEHRLYDAEYMLNLFREPVYDPIHPKRAKTESLYDCLCWEQKSEPGQPLILTPGSKGVMTHTIMIPTPSRKPDLSDISTMSSEEEYDFTI